MSTTMQRPVCCFVLVAVLAATSVGAQALSGSIRPRSGVGSTASAAVATSDLEAEAPALLSLVGGLRGGLRREIGRANRLEDSSRRSFSAHLEEEESAWPRGWQHNATLSRQAERWVARRNASHEKYHRMLAGAHTAAHRLERAEGLLREAAAGHQLVAAQLEAVVAVVQDAIATQSSSTESASEGTKAVNPNIAEQDVADHIVGGKEQNGTMQVTKGPPMGGSTSNTGMQKRAIQLHKSFIAVGSDTRSKTRGVLSNILVFCAGGVAVAFVVLAYNMNWNWTKAVETVQEDPKQLYEQFQDDDKPRFIPTACC